MKKLVWLVLCVVSLFSSERALAMLTSPTHYQYEVRQVKVDTLPVKQGYSSSAKTIATLKKDDYVYTTSQLIAGWRGVEGGGYVNNSLLTPTVFYGQLAELEAAPRIFKVMTSNAVHSAHGVVLTGVQQGDLVAAFGASNEVRSLKLGTQTGYANLRDLQLIAPTIRSASSKGGVQLRDKPSPSGSVLMTIPQHVPLASYGQIAGGWRVVTYGKRIGYVPASAMAAVAPVTRYVQAEGLPVYRTASRSGAVSAVLAHGIAVQAYAGPAGWSYVRVGLVEGYVPTQFLAAKKPAPLVATTFSGVPIDMRVVKQHATKIATRTVEKQTMTIYRMRNSIGIQPANTNRVYVQQTVARAEVNAVAEQLSADSGRALIGCADSSICVVTKIGLSEPLTLEADYSRLTYAYMKRRAKGEIQVAYVERFTSHDEQRFVTYRFDASTATFTKVREAIFVVGAGENQLQRFMREPQYLVH